MPSVSRPRGRAALRTLGCVLFALAAASSNAAELKTILLLHSFGRQTSPFDDITTSFRTEMLRAWPGKVAFYDASLEPGRAGRIADEAAIVQALHSRFGDMKLDLVVTVAAPAARFYVQHRKELFPTVPLMVLALDQRNAPLERLGPGDSVVGVRVSSNAIINGILELLPDTKTVAIVFGDSPLERGWVAEFRKELAPFENRVSFLWLDNLPLTRMGERVARLPPGSVVLYGLLLVDANGVPYDQDFAIAELYAASNAPIFGLFDSEMGQGIVGGPLLRHKDQAVAGAKVASRVLRGDPIQGDAATFLGPSTPLFDWRELQRWHIDENRLPPESVILFRPPSIWEEHRYAVLVSVGVVLLQAALITALIIQRTRRRRAERESFALSWRLLTAHEDERRRLARELHDDVTQRLARLAIDVARFQPIGSHAPVGPSQSVHGELVRLSEDVHALSYRLHPSILDDLGLAEALKAECEHVSRREPVRVEVELHQVPDGLPNDVALCIFRVAQEALRNIARHAKASVAIVSLALKDNGLLLAVRDNGIGFDVDATQSWPSLGRAGMGERVKLLGGNFGINSAFGQGTTVSAWVPLKIASS